MNFPEQQDDVLDFFWDDDINTDLSLPPGELLRQKLAAVTPDSVLTHLEFEALSDDDQQDEDALEFFQTGKRLAIYFLRLLNVFSLLRHRA